MRLDNQEFNFNFIESGENIIRCSNVEEAFFNIFDITFDEQTSLLKPTSKYVDGHPIVTLNVEYNNSVYENVEFKVVASKNEVPCVFINENHLINGYCFEPTKRSSSILEEQIDLIAEEVCEEVDWQHLNEQSKQVQENKIVNAIKHVEHQLSSRIDESLHDVRLSILAESINIQSKAQNSIEQKIEDQTQHLNVLIEQWKHAAEAKISNYIISAIDETRCTIEEQFEVAVQEQQQDSLDILSEKIVSIAIESKQAITNDLKQLIEHQSNLLHESVKDADENIKQHIAQKLNEFKQNVAEQNTESFDAGVVSFIDAQTQWMQKLVEGKIADVQQTLDGATIALEQKQDDLAQKLTNHVDAVVDAASTKIAEEAKTLHQEQLQNVRQCVDQVISEQISALQPTTEIIVTEARNTQKNLFKDAIGSIKTEISSEMQAHVANLQQDIYKKFAIYAQSYAGGGSVAVQYANGGTMNGSLNVAAGQILSGGIDLYNIFSTTGASGYQTIAFNESNAQLTIAPNGNTISLSALSGGNVGPSGEPLFTSWSQTYSANYESTYSTVKANSATNWNYQGTDVKALTANWQSTYSTVYANSAAWGTGGSPQTLSFNESNALLTISDGNTISLSALSGGSVGPSGEPLFTSWSQTYSANYQSTYSTVFANSANWNYQGTDIKALTGNWQSTYTTFNEQSATNVSVYSTVNSNSATVWNYQGTDIKSLTANWQSTYATVNSTSGSWSQTLTFDNATSDLTITPYGNTINIAGVATGKYLPLSGGSLTGALSTNQDIEITDATKGIILKSPNGTKYRVTVSNAGELTTTLI